MSKYIGISANLITLFCLLDILLTACRAKIVHSPGMPTIPATPMTPRFVAPTPTYQPSSAPTPTLSHKSLSMPTLPPITPTDVGSGFVEHTVQPGDTLLGVATAYDMPMAAIQLQNGLGTSTIVQLGQVLVIPPSVAWEGASRFWVVYVVRPDDTLVDIAQAYGLTVEALQAVNGLTDADYIVVGQELILPLDAPTVALASPLTPTSQPTAISFPTPTAVSVTAFPTPLAAPTTPPPADVAAWPRETVRLINEVRARHGLPPLSYNETLARAAQGQADDCAQRGWCSHTGSDDSNIKTRILRAGYEPASWAECWAQRKTPQGAVDIWMDEVPPNDPHRRTLLTTWLSEIGVGVSQTDWGYYFIADFGRPR